jgi:hypothetical protein
MPLNPSTVIVSLIEAELNAAWIDEYFTPVDVKVAEQPQAETKGPKKIDTRIMDLTIFLAITVDFTCISFFQKLIQLNQLMRHLRV